MRRAILCFCLLALSCSGEALDVGSTDAGTGATGGTGGTGGANVDPGFPIPPWPAPDACAAASDLDITGVWQGGIEDMAFQIQVPLRVEILGASEVGGVCGTVRWGEGALPPPPTDPERGWPPDLYVGIGNAVPYFHNGATFTILEGIVRDDQVRFRLNPSEFWMDWCAIQPPHWDSPQWSCFPDATIVRTSTDGSPCVLGQESGPDILVESGKCNLCRGNRTCVCNQMGCGASPSNPYTPTAYFDLVFEQNRVTGTVEGGTMYTDYTDVLLNRVE